MRSSSIDGKRFFRTGDLGYVDEDGYFFIVDRLKRMINAAGFKVWPAEVEAMLYAHPAIQEACIIATPRRLSRRDRQGGGGAERPRQRARRRGHHRLGARARWPRTRCRASSSSSTRCPRSATGKVQWRALQEKELAPSEIPQRFEFRIHFSPSPRGERAGRRVVLP